DYATYQGFQIILCPESSKLLALQAAATKPGQTRGNGLSKQAAATKPGQTRGNGLSKNPTCPEYAFSERIKEVICIDKDGRYTKNVFDDFCINPFVDFIYETNTGESKQEPARFVSVPANKQLDTIMAAIKK